MNYINYEKHTRRAFLRRTGQLAQAQALLASTPIKPGSAIDPDRTSVV